MLIYRLEDEAGYGPYQTGKSIPEMEDAHSNDMDNHPAIYRDVDGFVANKHLCGFISLDQLKTWFDGWLSNLLNQGYKVIEIRINAQHVLVGDKQICYDDQYVITRKEISIL